MFGIAVKEWVWCPPIDSSMYERRFEASLFKTMAELKKLQYTRKMEQSETAETEAASYRGRDARETQGQDALATARETQGRDALATECAKQSQSGVDKEELTPFMKREYELLTNIVPRPNKANDPQWEAGIMDQRAEIGLQRKTLPFDKLKAGVCRY